MTRYAHRISKDAQENVQSLLARAWARFHTATLAFLDARHEVSMHQEGENRLWRTRRQERENMRHRYCAPLYLAEPESQTDRLARETQHEDALRALTESHEKTDRHRADEMKRLEAERDRLAALADELRVWCQTLEWVRESEEGLAPWDRDALDALRRLDDLPQAADGEKAALTGKDVEALFKERLGVSRSAYYDRFRPLLKAHHLAPGAQVRCGDGPWHPLVPNGVKRWRRDEVEALLRFLQTGSVAVGRTAPVATAS